MEPSWLELAGRLSLFLFAMVVVALLIGGATRGLLRTSRLTRPALVRRPMRDQALDRIDRFLREYVGNVGFDELERIGGDTDADERQEDGETRALLDQIVSEMDRHQVSPLERETFLEDLRVAIRSEERLLALGGDGYEAERRFLETQRWALAERFHSIVEEPPPEIVARIKSGFRAAPDAARYGPDTDR